jgi:predicted phage terminase large subunit-like protein
MNIIAARGAALSPEDFLRDECDALRYERSLLDFIGGFWPSIEPKGFQSNWHIEAICDHLEAVVDREIKRGLLINIPPRHMKSLGANVFFPAWVWAQNPNPDNDTRYPFQIRRDSWRGPGVKFMHLSYNNNLATRDGRKCRTIISSPRYRRLWSHRVRLQPDQNQKTRFDNLAGGHRLSTSEGGTITGEGGDIIIFDDPHNVRAIGGKSDVAREKTLRFWDESMPSRLNDQQHGVFIVIMQRVHERDLSGHILATEMGWTHLCLPAVYESKHPHPIRRSVVRKSTGEVWKDPRAEGEALWPQRYSLEALRRMAKDEGLSTHMAAGQYQQRPTAREGGLFKRDWFTSPVKYAPEGLRLIRAWDLASSVESNADYTVGLLMGKDPETDLIYVIDVMRGHWSPGDVEIKIQSTTCWDGEGCQILIPQDPGSAGKFQARYLAGKLQGYSVRTEAEAGDKEYRANPFAAQCEHGFVKLVEGAWNQAFVDELCAFPNAAHDDQVDAASAAFRALTRRVTWNFG